MQRVHSTQGGFTLIETLIGATIFAVIALSAWMGLVKIFDATQVLRTKTTATNLATEQFEIIRNLPYDDVGVENSIPDGVVPSVQTLTRDNQTFEVRTIIRNIDLPFDGTIDGTPQDTSPADNKLVQVTISCVQCIENIEPMVFTTQVAPLALESTGNNGALFIEVFDANGQPVKGADVHIENNATTTPIVIDDVTNDEGMYQLVDAPPGIEAYEITVTKDGYSVDQTYTTGDVENPFPDKPHATVAAGDVTEISFAIDETSRLNVYSRRVTCSSVSSIDFNLESSKTIGQDVWKHDEDYQTDSSGWLQINGLEWDTYKFSILEANTHLVGANPNIPLIVNPGTTQSLDLMFAAADPNAVLVTVVDGSNDQFLSGATVKFTQGTASTTVETGSGHLLQTDWSGGAGQDIYDSTSRYAQQNGDIETTDPVGELKLDQFSGAYRANGWLESSTFDIGTTTNFLTLDWAPGDQPQATGDDAVRFQIATVDSLDPAPVWNFVGPNGDGSSYYETPGQAIASTHDGDRYLRYRVYLETENTSVTPNVSEVKFSFATDCTPVGQAYVSGLNNNAYDVTITKNGYETVELQDVLFTEDWQALQITLNPS